MMELRMKNGTSQSGQILLIVVLSIVVALTVGLAIASRSISNLEISRQNEESQRAFQAAEAGLARASRQLYVNGDMSAISERDLGNNAAFNVSIDPVEGNQLVLNGNNLVQRSVGIDVLMSDYSNNPGDPDRYTNEYSGAVQLYWGAAGQTCGSATGNVPAALEVLLLYGTNESDPQLYREVFDPCGEISNSTGATAGTHTVAGTEFRYRARFPSSGNMNNAMFFKVIPIFNSTKLGISASSALPTQGAVITSEGTSGETARRITYYQSHPQIPNELFPYAIISQ